MTFGIIIFTYIRNHDEKKVRASFFRRFARNLKVWDDRGSKFGDYWSLKLQKFGKLNLKNEIFNLVIHNFNIPIAQLSLFSYKNSILNRKILGKYLILKVFCEHSE